MSLSLSSSAFQHQGDIPTRHTCDGDNIAPALAWSGAPADARSFVLIVDDPDAPDPRHPRQTWVHWLVYNLPAECTGLLENQPLPAGAKFGRNDWNTAGYGGPCPPIGRHRYFHKLYALDTVLADLDHPTKSQLEQAMKGHVLAQAELVGTYER
jgi:Raf kinase inhibitor-like YbhB/YbcL family protein